MHCALSCLQKSDLLSNNRKLVHQGYVKWMTARGKSLGMSFLLVDGSLSLHIGEYLCLLYLAQCSLFVWYCELVLSCSYDYYIMFRIEHIWYNLNCIHSPNGNQFELFGLATGNEMQ